MMRFSNYSREISYDPMVMESMYAYNEKLGFESRIERLRRWRLQEKHEKLAAKITPLISQKLSLREGEAVTLFSVTDSYAETGRRMIPAITRQRAYALVTKGTKKLRIACGELNIHL